MMSEYVADIEKKQRQEKEEQRKRQEMDIFYRQLIEELEILQNQPPSEMKPHHKYYRFGQKQRFDRDEYFPNVWYWPRKNSLPSQGYTPPGVDDVISDEGFVSFYKYAQPISKEEYDKWVSESKSEDRKELDVDYLYSSPEIPMTITRICKFSWSALSEKKKHQICCVI